MRHMPADWPRPRTKEALIATVSRLASAPRKYGTFMTAAEGRALAFVHALHRK